MPKLRVSLLLCTTLLLSLVIASDVKAFDLPHQVSHNRFLKKRAPAPQLVPGVNGAGANPPTLTGTETTQSVSTPTAVATSSTSSASSASSSTSTTSASVGSVVSGLISSSSSTSTSTSSVSSSSSTSSTSSNTQAAPSIAQTSQDLPSVAVTPTQVVSGTGTSQTVVFVTDTSSSASPSATPSSLSSSSAGITHTALIILIVIAASVGGSIIIWTIIRKWKFGKSPSFDDRMQPIDWQPSTGDDGGIPGMNRRQSNASSFHSGSGHGHGGPSAAVVDPIPDHDFTPGPAHLAPVGGYADLARGPSPQPMMHELARGSSFSHQYQSDQYGVPLHHGGYGTGY